MTKIDIFSGFLGAGKTTLIKKLLQEAFSGEQVVLIENEFGEIGIDGGFLKEAGIEIREMNSGCICCSLVGDFCTAMREVISTYHDDQKGALRGENRIHILEGGSFRIAHAGDLGCELLPEEKEALKGLDLLMVPVGGYYTIDARQAKKMVEDIKPRVVIPMHYRGEGFGFDVLAPLEDYTSLCDDVVDYDKNTLELAKDMPVQTAVLKLAKE